MAQTVYRSLLRSARAIDAQPAGRALLSLSSRPSAYYDQLRGELVELPKQDGVAGALGAILRDFFGGGEFYRPERSLETAVRAVRRSPPAERPLDVGLAALRVLGEAAERADAVSQHLIDANRCEAAIRPLVRVAAGEVVRPGSLLLTHPLACMMQPSLHRAVILITSVTDDSVVGVVINKPLDTKVGAVVTDEAREMLGPVLASSTLHKGGDVAESQIVALHDLADVPGAMPVGPGLWLSSNLREGELRHALACQAAECVSGLGAPRVKVIHGCAGWAPLQLRSELDRGVWFLVEAKDRASIAPLGLMQEFNDTNVRGGDGRAQHGSKAIEGGGGDGGTHGAVQHRGMEMGCANQPSKSKREMAAQPLGLVGGSWLCDTMWSGVIHQLGEGYSDLARFPALDASTELGARLLGSPPPS